MVAVIDGRSRRSHPPFPAGTFRRRPWPTPRFQPPPKERCRPLSRHAVGAIVTRHVTTAAVNRPSLTAKRTTPHTLRHTNAMLLRAKGVDIAADMNSLITLGTPGPDSHRLADTSLRVDHLNATTSKVITSRTHAAGHTKVGARPLVPLGAHVRGQDDTEWTRTALIRDPQGAEFTASQFTPSSG